MENYKQLYFQSQAALANAIETLEKLTEELRWCMNSCEDAVITAEEAGEEQGISQIP